MGNRVSVCFINGKKESVVLFSHWDGMNLVKRAKEYVKLLKKEMTSEMEPLGRFEPETVMVDFIRVLTKNERRIMGNYYLEKNEFDGDNTDNGHYKIKL